MSAEKTRKALRILDFRHKKAAFKRLDCISYGAKAGLEHRYYPYDLKKLNLNTMAIIPSLIPSFQLDE